jgi:hypothetical protein
MIRFLILFICFSFVGAYATTEGNDDKKASAHIEHPDHIPHGHEKNPIKKVSHDDGLLPRKRRKLRVV